MDRIAREMEANRTGRSPAFDAAVGRRLGEGDDRRHPRQGANPPARTEDAIAVAVCAASELLQVPLILCFTSSGFTARKVATYRPTVPIIGATPEAETYRHLSLVWGVLPMRTTHSVDYDSLLNQARAQILEGGLARAGERVVVTAGVPFDVPGTTNFLKIEAL
jgi:pyruvate kinase